MGIAVVDLFAGAGGFAIASRLAKCDLRLSVEIDPVACRTLRANDFGKKHTVEECDVRDLSGSRLRRLAQVPRSAPLLIVGGPPCQPFSKASYWTDPGLDAEYRRARARGETAVRPAPINRPKKDNRRDLLSEFLRLVVESRADGFVMENVRSLFHPRNRPTFDRMLAKCRTAGYQCTVVDADASSFGVPQKRQRIFVLGTRGKAPRPPKLTHA
jgi:DNA (cytosine-5)-methyltransferase 1